MSPAAAMARRRGRRATPGRSRHPLREGRAKPHEREPRRRPPIATRPVDLGLAGRESRGQGRFERRELVERPSLGDPEVGLAPAVVDDDRHETAAFAIAVAVFEGPPTQGLDTTRIPGRELGASSAASVAAAARPGPSSDGSLRPQ